ncbi:hypothetical protein HAX54_043015 [Datura stramonium]|uniref:Uncharacterized protein n=1 Tax=Datura stramonium TaxID=4076 RepID=A0ABS8RR25_DATST|nr:hypothetical protein [Datura stramonium]
MWQYQNAKKLSLQLWVAVDQVGVLEVSWGLAPPNCPTKCEAHGSQGFCWLVDGGAMSAATSCFKVPTSHSRTSTVEHRLASLSLAGYNAFLMAVCIMEGIALDNRTSWFSCILALSALLSRSGGGELWNSAIWSGAVYFARFITDDTLPRQTGLMHG